MSEKRDERDELLEERVAELVCWLRTPGSDKRDMPPRLVNNRDRQIARLFIATILDINLDAGAEPVAWVLRHGDDLFGVATYASERDDLIAASLEDGIAPDVVPLFAHSARRKPPGAPHE